MMMKAQGGPQDGQMNEEGKETVDYMKSDRVIGKDNTKVDIGMILIIVPAADEGKDAFNGMIAAVNSADERVKSFTGELQRAIDQADEKKY